QLVDRVGRVEIHPCWPSSLAVWPALHGYASPRWCQVYRLVSEARGGPRGRGWTVVTPGVPIAA
ncbi:hypothetical protein KI387_000223, partial [Taxus chinensis]